MAEKELKLGFERFKAVFALFFLVTLRWRILRVRSSAWKSNDRCRNSLSIRFFVSSSFIITKCISVHYFLRIELGRMIVLKSYSFLRGRAWVLSSSFFNFSGLNPLVAHEEVAVATLLIELSLPLDFFMTSRMLKLFYLCLSSFHLFRFF